LGHGCSPSAALHCEAYIFCELQQSPKQTPISHKDSPQHLGLLRFPFWAISAPFPPVIPSKQMEMSQFCCRTKAMGFPLPAAWDNNTHPCTVTEELPQRSGQKVREAASQEISNPDYIK